MNSLLCILSSTGQICDIIFQNKTGLGSWSVGPDENWLTKLKKNISQNTINLLRAAAKQSIKLSLLPPFPLKRYFDFLAFLKILELCIFQKVYGSIPILMLAHSGLFSLIPWATMGIFYSYVTSLAPVSAPTQGETGLTVLRGILCRLMMEYLTLYFCFVLFRMRIRMPSPFILQHVIKRLLYCNVT